MIISIGAQNSHILNQGIKKSHHFLAASICMLCDAALIALGGCLVAQSLLPNCQPRYSNSLGRYYFFTGLC
ncbi:MAG: arginine exporter protein ArgO [Cognaticolwellia sp.]|jgi:arginine exporter protein ArgO